MIKERAAIKLGSSVMNRTASAVPRDYILLPNDGTIQISLEVAGQIHNEIPESAYFRIRSRDTTIDCLVRDYASLSDNGTYSEGNLCTGTFSEVTMYWRYPIAGYDPSLFYRVHAQDTIWFAYHSTDWNEETWVDSIGEQVWEISMTKTDPCYVPPLPDLTCRLKLEFADTVLAAFRVEALADTIAYGDTARIIVTAVNARNQEVALDGNTLLTFTLDSTRFGCFISPAGATVSSPLSNVTYSDAKAGHVKFFANGARDTARLRELRIKVETSEVTGERIICLAHLNLKILERDGWQLWPYIDNADKGANRPGYNPRRAFTVEVKDFQGKARANQEVLLQTAFRPKSGGHDHSQSHDTIMTWALKGRFWAQNRNGNPRSGIRTGADGRLVVDSLRASMFSGSYIVYASLVSDTTVFDSVALNVRVPDLVQFGSGDKWRLTGVPGEGEDSLGLNHPSNHWCTQAMKDTLEVILNEFYEWSKTPKGGGTAIRLGVNDMALEQGGVFDIRGDWGQGFHVYHRVGCSVDIDQAGGLKKADGTLSDKGEHLLELMEEHKAEKYPEGPIHFGFDGCR